MSITSSTQDKPTQPKSASRYSRHAYTLTEEAYSNLLLLFPSTPSKATVWRRTPLPVYNHLSPTGIDYETQSYTLVQGLSNALTLLSRNYDLHEWTPAPKPHPYAPPKTNPITGAQEPNLVWYNPYDSQYMAESLSDDTPWLELPQWERDQRQLEISRLRHKLASTGQRVRATGKPQRIAVRHCLALSKQTRAYYSALRSFFNIPLPPRSTHPHSLTTHVATVLEAIGTHHLIPPPDYMPLVTQTPNPRKVHLRTTDQAIKLSHASRVARRYGNHSGDAWIMHEWRSLPKLTKEDGAHPWTQEDVTWAATNGLLDLATEAVTLNPTCLSLPDGVKPYQPAQSTNSQPTHVKHHIDLVLPTEPNPSASPTYQYKSRDITALILQAHDLHYGQPPTSYPQLAYLAERFSVPLYTIRTLATREHVRRLMAK